MSKYLTPKWWRYLWYWWGSLIGKDVCPPDCPLCEVQARMEAHYEGCAECQSERFPCATFKTMQVEEEAATYKVFPVLAPEWHP